MYRMPPAEIGMPLEEVETPALILDLDAFERNVRKLAQALEGKGVRLRAHSKTHKCAVVGRIQMAHGAVGLCCQKVAEAEAMVHAGIPDVLISNQVVGRRKLLRVAALARQARVAICVDDPAQVAMLEEAAAVFDVRLRTLVEINVGGNRCGVAPGEPALALARRIAASPHLTFAGIQAYQGRAQHIRDFGERRAAIDQAVAWTRETVELLRRDGLACEIVGGAGTGTFAFESASGVFNEIQAGSYVFMDVDYALNLGANGGMVMDFEHSLFVYATVISRPVPERAVADAGLKAFTAEKGMPWVHGMDGVEATGVSDEHVTLALADPGMALPIGSKLKLIPPHCDPAVNLHDWYVGIRNGRVESLWPIAARGPSI